MTTTPNERLTRVDQHARTLLAQLPKNLTYHNPDHTLHPEHGVVAVTRKLATLEHLTPHENELTTVAAYYHDTGYLEQYHHNEPISARIATNTLPHLGYTPEETKIISDAILTTKNPTKPKNKLEAVLCDADVDNLGRDDFFEKNEAVRNELGITDVEQWYRDTITFLMNHHYYTDTAKKLRDEKKQKNLDQLFDLLLNPTTTPNQSHPHRNA